MAQQAELDLDFVIYTEYVYFVEYNYYTLFTILHIVFSALVIESIMCLHFTQRLLTFSNAYINQINALCDAIKAQKINLVLSVHLKTDVVGFRAINFQFQRDIHISCSAEVFFELFFNIQYVFSCSFLSIIQVLSHQSFYLKYWPLRQTFQITKWTLMPSYSMVFFRLYSASELYK